MHRDLKPHNIMLDEHFNIKVIDFGDAKKIDEDRSDEEESEFDYGSETPLSDSYRDRTGTFVGTVNYLAPEMVADYVSTLETDLWALGCIVFKMVTGKVAFAGMELFKVRQLILNR